MHLPLILVVLVTFGATGCKRDAPPVPGGKNAELQEVSKPEFTLKEPKFEDLIGVWQPDKKTLADLQARSSEPKLIELILRQNGSCLLQGVPAKWVDESKREMPLRIRSASGRWTLRRNWDGWEIRLEAPEHASFVVTLRGERPPYSIVVPCADSHGSFHAVFHRSLLKE